jgi:hypothetical protein
MFAPPYSPNNNPVESIFSIIKNKYNKIKYNLVNLKIIIEEVIVLFKIAKKRLFYAGKLYTRENNIKLLYIDTLAERFMNFLVVITDLYFMRRFLDKKYIKNGILYTGLYHFYNISYLLVKYFNYKITNIFVCNPKFKITDEIKKLKFDNYEYIDVMYLHAFSRLPNFNIAQCVNLDSKSISNCIKLFYMKIVIIQSN